MDNGGSHKTVTSLSTYLSDSEYMIYRIIHVSFTSERTIFPISQKSLSLFHILSQDFILVKYCEYEDIISVIFFLHLSDKIFLYPTYSI